jgi:hypothetical protein
MRLKDRVAIVTGARVRMVRISVGTGAKIVSLLERFAPVHYGKLLKKGFRE